MTAPLFVHDCKRCAFLGHFMIDGMVGDGYVCGQPSASVLWRVSDEGWEYHSFPIGTVRGMQRDRDAGEPGAEGSVFTDILEKWDAITSKEATDA